MRIVFVNPPSIRSTRSGPENDFRIDGLIVNRHLRRIPWFHRVVERVHRMLGKEIRYGIRAGSRWPWSIPVPQPGAPFPFFMGYAAGLLKANGYEVDILDAIVNEEYDYVRFMEKVKAARPDIAVIECSTPTIDIDLWFAKKLAAHCDVALAGPHLAAEAENVREKSPHISYLLKGEYILSALKMAGTRVKGIYESEVVKDLDAIPFPFRDFEGGSGYYEVTMPTPRPQLQIYGSKGCPFKCTFCSWPQTMYFGNVALRKPAKIAEEVREAIKLHGYRSIFFDDDTFNMGVERVSELCDELKKIGLPWTMMGRLDCSPDRLYDKMVESGCVGMRFGIETFDIDILKKVKKGLEREDFKATLGRLSKKYPGVMIHLTMMKDMPGMTDEIHAADMRFLKEMGYSEGNVRRSYQLSRCAPFPGTEMYREMVERYGAESLKDYTLYDGGKDTVMKRKAR